MFDFYITHEYWFAAFQLITAMLGMGATLTVADFRAVFKKPKSLTLSLLLQLIYIPVLTILFIRLFGIVGGVAVGFAIIAALPGGSVSNIFTYIAKGNAALSIALTTTMTLACVVFTPYVIHLIAADYLADDFTMPYGKIGLEIAAFLLVPLFVGMLTLKTLPKLAPFITKWGVRLSVFTIILIVIGALGSGRIDIPSFGVRNIFLVIFFITLLSLTIRPISRILFRMPNEDVVASELECIVKSTNLGLMIKASLFPAVLNVADPIGDLVLFTVLFYGGSMLVTAGIMMYINKTVTKHQSSLPNFVTRLF